MTSAAAGHVSVGSAPGRPLWAKAESFHQIGIVVADLDTAMAELSTALGIPAGGWDVLSGEQSFEHHESGGVLEARTRYARARSGATVYQLLQPLDGNTVWRRWLDAGVSVFATGYFVRDLEDKEEELLSAGAQRLAWGEIPEGEIRYRYSFLQLQVSRLVVELMTRVD